VREALQIAAQLAGSYQSRASGDPPIAERGPRKGSTSERARLGPLLCRENGGAHAGDWMCRRDGGALTGCAGACYSESPEIVLHQMLIPKKKRSGISILRRNAHGDAS
jgi:hypothetical protein